MASFESLQAFSPRGIPPEEQGSAGALPLQTTEIDFREHTGEVARMY